VQARELIKRGMAYFRIGCDEEKLRALVFYVEELMRWNKKINLTGIRDTRLIICELLYDAFFLHGYMQNVDSLMDLGTGSGVLAIPLSILNENVRIFAVDKSLRKIQFLRHIKRTLNLRGLQPLHGRSEEIACLGVESLVVKAFGTVDAILETGGVHVKYGGRALIVKGKSGVPVDYRGFILEDTIGYELPEVSKPYTLLVYKKVS